MPPYYDDEVMAPLVRREGESSNSSPRNSKNRGIMANRILVILTLVMLVLVSLYFQSSTTTLSHQLETDEDKITLMSQTIEAQSKIVQRFNESVTNSDVLKQLKQLQESLEKSQHDLQEQLDTTTKDVNEKLDQTLTDLDATVNKAEEDISNQVDTVKKDFEQYVIKTQDQFSMENSFMVYQLAGTLTLLSCLISMWHMTAHLRKLNQPVIQRKILAILWMSPVYAVTSWFSLVFHPAEGYLAIIKDAYEAYVIYQFLSFCIAVLGKGDRQIVVDLLTRRADHLTPPFRLFFCCKRDPYENDRALADAILFQCQFFAMQFVFFRPVTTIVKVVLDKYSYYGPWAEGPNDYRAPQFYIVLIQNLSIFTAFTGLLKFYHAVDKDLEWCRPFAKFLCIKGVVFMTFWQGLAITILAETTDVGGSDAEEWAMSAQNFLICLEMLLFSIAHFYCFPTDEWEENYKVNFVKSKFGDSIALGDFVADLKFIMKGTSKKKKKKPTEPTVPEGDEENQDDGEAADRQYDSDDDDEENQNDDASTSVASEASGNASDLEDAKRVLVNAIQNEMGDNNPELEEARQRILASGFLNDLAFMSPIRPVSGEGNNTLPNEETKSYPQRLDSGAVESKEKESELAHEEVQTERTSLLSSQDPATSSLRPSIFTTVADLHKNTSS